MADMFCNSKSYKEITITLHCEEPLADTLEKLSHIYMQPTTWSTSSTHDLRINHIVEARIIGVTK
jgi:hypothetical protein